MAKYDFLHVSKHNIPVEEFKRLQPVMIESRVAEFETRSYHTGTIEITAGTYILAINLFSEDIENE